MFRPSLCTSRKSATILRALYGKSPHESRCMVSAPILHGIAAHTSPCAVKLGQSVNMEPTIVRTGSPLSVSRVPFPSSVFRFRAPFSVFRLRFLFRVPCFVSAFHFPFLLPVSMFSSPCPFPCVSVFAPHVRCPCSVSVSRVRCPFPLSVRGKILSKPCRARWTDLYKSRNRHNSSNS